LWEKERAQEEKEVQRQKLVALEEEQLKKKAATGASAVPVLIPLLEQLHHACP
jgi:hypothetical protein